MSLATERRAACETLAAWTLMSTSEVASFLGVSVDTVKRLKGFPWAKVGGQYRADPVEVALWVLARREGLSPEDYRASHGEDEATERAIRYLRDIRRAQGEG